MKTVLLKVSIFWSCLFFSFDAGAQQDPIKALNKLYDDFPQEKIYLWFNKPGYVSGETIWFKAYIFSGYDISLISTSLYVEFYDSEKKLIKTKLYPILSGAADGSIEIDSKLPEGVYYIRVYTRWMLNFKDEFQLIKPILVYNSSSAKKLTIDPSLWKASASPEGGNLVDGIETKVAVRRIAATTLPGKWGGYLYEETNPHVKIKEFISIDENVGLFSFTPEQRKQYIVYVSDDKGNFQVCKLGDVKTSGIAVSLRLINDSLNCLLRFKNITGGGNGYSVIGEIQNQLIYQAKISKATAELSINIPVSNDMNGIMHLTVFDTDKKPVAERLVFLNPARLNVDTNVLFHQSVSSQSRSLSEIELHVDSVSWINYAASVSDAAAPSSTENENILSALWLTSDLTQPIQNPGKYFLQTSKSGMEALDAIMISEKWQRFDWEEVLSNKFPTLRYLPYPYLSYSGVVSKGNKLRPNEEVNLILYFPDSSTQVINTKTDNAGNIVLNNLVYTGDVKVYYQLNTKKYSARLIDIKFESNNNFIPFNGQFPVTSYTLSTPSSTNKSPDWVERSANTIKQEKEVDNKYKPLQELVIRSNLKTAKEQLNEKLSSGLFRSMNDEVFDFVNENQNAIGFTNILQFLQGRVAGLTVRFDGMDFNAFIRGRAASLYIDEMRADASMVSTLSINDIAMVKVIKGPFALMTSNGGGTIAIYTLRGDMRPAQKEPSLPGDKIKGYDSVKTFYSPDYSDNSLPQPDKDSRDQLLWQPVVPPTSAVNRSVIGFYNNDRSSRFRLIIQGFNEKGFPVLLEKIIEPVQKSF